MKKVQIEEINEKALDLFAKARKAFSSSSNEKLRERSRFVPERFVDEDKKVRIVFAGQYSAGKSSILSILTGKELEVGQGVTTNTCNYLDWNGIEVVDTPGIHTQKRPDHDEITYQAMSEADLIIFVCTAEGFSEGLGTHFRKLLVEKGKGNEMLLVFNKMESSGFGNTPEGREEFFKKDVLPVISPEFSSEDLFISYVDVYSYIDAQEASDEEREYLLEMSGFEDFISNINSFIEKKKVLGKCTTSLYKLEQMLSEAMSEFKTGDYCSDGAIELLNQQRRILLEAKENIRSKSYNLVRKNTQEVKNWGYDIANQLTSSSDEKEVNEKLKEKYEATEDVYQKSAKELEKIIQLENESLVNSIKNLESSEFVSTLKSAVEKKIGDIKMSKESSSRYTKYAQCMKESGEWLSNLTKGTNASTGWSAIFKLGNYSGSQGHQAVLKIGHFFGHKFKPWEAVKITSKVGQFGKVLGVGGALVGVVMQIYNDKQEEKVEKELVGYRGDIRNSFVEAANAIELKFDEDTQTWIEENISSQISEIDSQIKEIENSVQSHENEFERYHTLINETRELISEVQRCS
jgi:small GTP-binding protein